MSSIKQYTDSQAHRRIRKIVQTTIDPKQKVNQKRKGVKK